MLVLSRRPGESIDLVDPSGKVIAEVEVVRVVGEKVRIGVVAEGLGIHRREIRRAIEAEGRNPGVVGALGKGAAA